MDTKFVGDFETKTEVENDFEYTLKPNEQLLIAAYDNGGYDGSAWVLYKDSDTNKLYEVNGAHCSCYGLEGQWEPEETSVESLAARIKDGHVGPYDIDVAPAIKELFKL